MNVGSVFFDKQFDFGDGDVGRKLFIVLGTVSGISVAVKTTTQQHGRGTTFGCQLKDRFSNFFMPIGCCDLKATTWVCLDVYYELDQATVLKKHFHGIIDPICELPLDLARRIQDCALVSQDITPAQEAIVRACLVAVPPASSFPIP